MKKIILAIFLMLGVLSFASPDYVDKEKFQENGYHIRVNESDSFTIVKRIEDTVESIVVSLDENKVAKFVKLSKEKTDEKDLLFIAFKSDGFNININANSYLFQEGTGDKYENARYSKVVLVGNNLRLIDLRDKDFKEIKWTTHD